MGRSSPEVADPSQCTRTRRRYKSLASTIGLWYNRLVLELVRKEAEALVKELRPRFVRVTSAIRVSVRILW
jgi:hypothetical protein